MRIKKFLVLGTLLLATPAMLPAADRPAPANASTQYAMAFPPVDGGGRSLMPRHRLIMQVSEQEVREWLASYQKAWESHDVAALSALGVIQEHQQPALRKSLSSYGRLDVSVSNETISVDGGWALLSFDRLDTDETGRELKLPRQIVLLERTPAGIVSTWRGTVVK